MRVIFFGTPDFAVLPLVTLLQRGHAVPGVVTRPDKPVGRSGAPQPPPVKRVALEAGLPVWQPDSVRTDGFLAEVAAASPDLLVVVAYGKILPAALLEAAPRGAVNLHGSLLPRWRGAAPIQWAIASGDRETGVSTMQMDEGMDTGPVLLSRSTPIGEEETAVELSHRLSEMGAELLAETVEAIAGGTTRAVPQDPSRATHAPILKAGDGLADWSLPAERLYDRWRGFQPWPGLHTVLRGRRLGLERVKPLTGAGPPAPLPPGTIWSPGKGRVAVACGEGSHLELVEVRPEGRKALRAIEAWNGRYLVFGARCGFPESPPAGWPSEVGGGGNPPG